MTDKNNQNTIENAAEIILRFGGIRPMAHKMAVPVTTVQGWKKRNTIPGNRRAQLIKAAQNNDIDLSGLVAGVANENTFDEAMKSATQRQDIKTKKPHKDPAITATRRAAATTESMPTNEDMINQIRQAQSMAFTKSAWFSALMIVTVVILSAVFLWPSKQQIEKNGKNITELRGDVTAVKKQSRFLGGLIPDDIEARFGQIQKQTIAIQEKMSGFSEKAENIASDVLDPNTNITTRIERLGAHIEELAGPSQLTTMLQKIQTLSQSLEGQKQLANSVKGLNALFQGLQGSDNNIDEALQQAQKEDDALGRTLQGVAPEDLKAASLLLGMAQFRSSLHRSAPFEEDLALMQKLLGDNDPELQAAITRLAPKAARGVLTPKGLKGELKGLAGDIVVASLKGEDVSVQERAKARLNNILQVEKDGELITGTDTQAKILRAQKMLDEGNIEGAIAALQTLEGPAATTAQPFIDKAQVTLMAQQLQGLFTSRVMSRVTSSRALGGVSTKSAGMAPLIQEIKKLAPQRHVIGNKDSGFVILSPKAKTPLDMLLEP